MIELIAEWGQPRSIEQALEQAHATHEIGGVYAKWQLFNPARIASKDAKRYWAPSLGGSNSQLETFRLASGLEEQDWQLLARSCWNLDVEPLVTPFDLEAVEVLERLNVHAYKIASGDITYRALIEQMAKTGKRVFLSTGAAGLGEIRRALHWLKGCEVVVLACDLVYPCPAKDADLARTISVYRDLSDRIGYSDHTRELVTGAVAVTLGATVLEKHVTLDPEGEAPDDRMALTVDQAQMYRKLAEQAANLCGTVDGDPQAAARIGARRSAHAAQPLEAGRVLRASDIAWLRPCPEGAIDPAAKLAGRTLARPVGIGERIEREALI